MKDALIQRIARSAAARLGTLSSRSERAALDLEFRKLGVNGVNAIPTWTTKMQLETLYRLASSLPSGACVAELGSYKGASTCYLAAGASRIGGTVIAIDLFNNETIPGEPEDTFAEFQKNIAGVAHLVKVVRKRTNSLAPEDVNPPVHLGFIDADHSYESTKADAAFLAPLIAADGMLAFHDTTAFEGVNRVIGELLTTGDWCLGGHVENLTWLRRAKWTPWPLVADHKVQNQ